MIVSQSPAVGVVHIVLKLFGIDTFKTFLRSYTANSSGLEHQLILVFKGFADQSDAREYMLLMADTEYSALFLEDEGYDIGSYFRAKQASDNDYYCFLNSRSVILASDWLAKMYSYACRTAVGVVGATASCESLYTDYVNIGRFNSSEASLCRRLSRSSLVNKLRHFYYYPPFPNYHVRTNAFMMRREVLNRIKVGKMKTRVDTSRFENGRNSLTRQLINLNLETLIVGKNGNSYSMDRWHKSDTFRQGDQGNLLVADNQTDNYANASEDEKAVLSQLAWGRPGALRSVRFFSGH